MVLFLFVVMLMNLNSDSEPKKNNRLKMAGVISGGCLMLIMIDVVRSASEMQKATAMLKEGNIGLIRTLGMALFKDYVVPFEISSVLFLSAMVGAVVIGKKD
jgi:NADH-quinone oxidoreductase subunit J